MTKTQLKKIIMEVANEFSAADAKALADKNNDLSEYRTKGAVGKKNSPGTSNTPSDSKVEKAIRTFLSTRKDHAPHIDQLQDIAHMLGLNSIKNDIDDLFDAISDKLDKDKSGFERIYSYLLDKKLVKESISRSKLVSLIKEVISENSNVADAKAKEYWNMHHKNGQEDMVNGEDVEQAFFEGYSQGISDSKPMNEELQGHKQTIDFVNDMEKIVNDSPELKKYSHIKGPLLKAIDELKSGSSLRGKAKMLEDLSKELVTLIKSPLFKSKPTDYNKNIAIFSDKVKKIAHS